MPLGCQEFAQIYDLLTRNDKLSVFEKNESYTYQQRIKKALKNGGPCKIAWLGRVFYAEHRLRLAGQ